MERSDVIPRVVVRELKKTDWPNVVKLFTDRGACGGCWCMHWRTERGGQLWEDAKGEPNRRAFKKLVESGKALGILAFDGKTPIGWCSFGRRVDFPRTERMKAYRRDDIQGVWSINCFFLDRRYRGKGLSHQLVEGAVKAIRRRKGKIIEAYPVTLTAEGDKLPAAFSYTGPEGIFQKLGFVEVQRLAPSRPLYQLELS